jgi:hypothetical protein
MCTRSRAIYCLWKAHRSLPNGRERGRMHRPRRGTANCSTILVRESCPVQFGCGDTNRTTPSSVCGSPIDACMNQENYNQCKFLEEGGYIDFGVSKSCPLQFACNDDGPVPAPRACSKPTDRCMNRQNWARCKALEKRCNVLVLESCPLQFARLQADGIGVRESDLQLFDTEALETVSRARKGGMPEHCQLGKLSVLWVSMRGPARRMRKVPGILDATVPPRHLSEAFPFRSGASHWTRVVRNL